MRLYGCDFLYGGFCKRRLLLQDDLEAEERP